MLGLLREDTSGAVWIYDPQPARHRGSVMVRGLSTDISVQVSFSVLWIVLDSLGFGRIKQTALRLLH